MTPAVSEGLYEIHSFSEMVYLWPFIKFSGVRKATPPNQIKGVSCLTVLKGIVNVAINTLLL